MVDLASPEDPTEHIETVESQEPQQPKGQAPMVASVTTANLLRHPDAHPVALDYLMIRKYGLDWFEWEPETFEIILPRDFKGGVSDLNLSKIQAVKAMHMVDDYWLRWEVFNWITAPLNSVFPNFEVMQVPTVAQCMVSVDIANRVRTDVAWSDEVKAFLGVVHQHDDIFVPQEPLEFVKIDTAGLPLNVEEIALKWIDVRSSGKAPAGNNITDEQLRRMLLVHGYLVESRDRLHQQMSLLPNV